MCLCFDWNKKSNDSKDNDSENIDKLLLVFIVLKYLFYLCNRRLCAWEVVGPTPPRMFKTKQKYVLFVKS